MKAWRREQSKHSTELHKFLNDTDTTIKEESRQRRHVAVNVSTLP